MAEESGFLSRWSRRKIEARAADPAPAQPMPPVAQGQPQAPEPVPAAPQPLPPVESLTPDSDFKPFMGAQVDGDLRRQALKTLFTDPRYNVMDMMDVYVDDYSKPDPLPEGWLEKLEQVSRLGDRAGRDREEAERRKAEALARERGEAPPPDEALTSGDASDAPMDAAGPESAPVGTGDAAALAPETANPTRNVGESGT